MKTLAAKTAQLAGEHLISRLRENGSTHIQEKTFGETVTNFDKEINEYIIEELKAHVPEHNIVTEESDAINNGNRHTWYVDPIDGTNNFVRGVPMYGISIGYETEHVIQAGAVYDPMNRELFSASIKEGAFENGTLCHVSSTTHLEEAMIAEGAGYNPKHRMNHVSIMNRIARTARHRRNLGTSALVLAYIARGGIDGCVFSGVKSWDCVGGAALVLAAGGRVTNFEGKPWTPDDSMLIASNGKIHDQLLQLTR